ncbi:hypothetical protein [Humisphaera borealis]|uniref:Uncharacterized protein n=1 Tax=Humisphaera borealis TaxID=2807512 RepID=A0A7M2X074_9BACT|nr:hypothetical protein [Humisphaera borealis]QOV91177.1 hypothetical protein IPV69_07405 [Humisphaera borealis]
MVRLIDKKMDVSYSTRFAIVIAWLVLLFVVPAVAVADAAPSISPLNDEPASLVDPVIAPIDETPVVVDGTLLDDLALQTAFLPDTQAGESITPVLQTTSAPVLIAARPAFWSALPLLFVVLLLPKLRRILA